MPLLVSVQCGWDLAHLGPVVALVEDDLNPLISQWVLWIIPGEKLVTYNLQTTHTENLTQTCAMVKGLYMGMVTWSIHWGDFNHLPIRFAFPWDDQPQTMATWPWPSHGGLRSEPVRTTGWRSTLASALKAGPWASKCRRATERVSFLATPRKDWTRDLWLFNHWLSLCR